jgi:hypothetical protein
VSETANLPSLYRAIAETVAWCRLRANLADPQDSLRTPSLRPANLSIIPDQWGVFDWASEYRRRHYNTATLRQLEAAGLLKC